MFWTIIQYIFIAVVFGIAIFYLVGMFKKSFSSKNKKSCSKGCGCSTPEPEKEEK